MFVREMRRVKERSSPEETYDYFVAEQGLEVLLDTLYDLTALYPVWRTCLIHPSFGVSTRDESLAN